MASSDIVLLLVALVGLYAVKELGILSSLRSLGSRRMALQAGGFGVGIMWGPAVISAVTGAFSGLAAISATNLAGLTDIGPQTALVIGLAFIAMMVLSRINAEDS